MHETAEETIPRERHHLASGWKTEISEREKRPADNTPKEMQRLSPTQRERQMHAEAEKIIHDERAHITKGGDATGIEWWGIGLSGGGIRSASLALGVLQSLAEHDLLKKFHFVSSVSGGGYIASSLQWWWSQAAPPCPKSKTEPLLVRDDPASFGSRPYNFPFGPAHPSSEATGVPPEPAPPLPVHPRAALNLSFLRAHSAYLTPGHGLNIWSMIGVLLRTIVIAVATWLPLLASAMGLLFLLDNLVAEPFAKWLHLYSPLGGTMPTMWTDWGGQQLDNLLPFRYSAIFALPLLLSYLLITAFVSAAILFALVSHAPQSSTSPRSLRGSIASIILILGLISTLIVPFKAKDVSVSFLIAALIVFLSVIATTLIADYFTDINLTPSYMLRRNLETTMGKLFVPTLALFALGTIPYVPYYIAKNAGTQGAITGILSLLAGVVSALYGYYTFLRNLVPSLVGQIAATAGAILYLYATLVFAYFLIVLLISPEILATGVNADSIKITIWIGIPLSMLLALSVATRSNINFVGLHRFYRDRLMEAFMPTNASVDAMKSQFSPTADNLSVSALADLSLPQYGFPYPIINTNAILINDPHSKYASRGGDNFMISPLYVGSTATGWRRTSEYVEMNGPLTLATATAASGAAASASAGYIGTGITRNPLVSAVMSLLNIRLGLWVANPFWQGKRPIRIPTFLHPGLVSGIFQQAHTFDSKYLELTDGGHFENLALYELVRRRTKVIFIVDGEADPKISLSSLVSAIRRIEEDFGATLKFDGELGPDRLMMYPKQRYPAETRYAAAPFMIGRLTYSHPEEQDGLLIYIKSTLIEQIDFPTAGYLASNPQFPHQSTVDQFFDPAQFDAYRCLGYKSTEIALSALTKYQGLEGYPTLKDALKI